MFDFDSVDFVFFGVVKVRPYQYFTKFSGIEELPEELQWSGPEWRIAKPPAVVNEELPEELHVGEQKDLNPAVNILPKFSGNEELPDEHRIGELKH